MKITTKHALASLRPDASWKLRGDVLTWEDESQTRPTDSEIATEITRLQTEYDNNKYQRDREISYPSIQEQLDLQYWDQVNGTTKWKEAIAKVKADNPKP